MNNMLIGLAGLKRSGKNTVADMIGSPQLAFADPLKKMLLSIDPIILEREFEPTGQMFSCRLAEYVEAWGWEKAKENPEVRRLLQETGQSVRAIDPDFWVRALRARLSEPLHVSSSGYRATITDVRMPNEARMIRDHGGQIWYIENPRAVNDGHITENSLRPAACDRVIVNGGTLDDLRKKVEEALNA